MPRLSSISGRIVTPASDRTPVFIKNYSGTDFSSYHSTWTFSTGTISLRSSTLPYHSYGNVDDNTATNQLCNKTWSFRAGTTIDSTSTTTSIVPTPPDGNIGYWINGVNMYDPSAGTEAPNGYLSFTHLNYNAAYETTLYYSYSLEQDNAGGQTSANGNYHYHNLSFSDAWTTGNGHVSGTAGTTGTAEVSLISYLNGSLTHSNGHSKILGWSLDGYPVYGPYGYSRAMDRRSGVRSMISGYATYARPADVENRVIDGALNTTTFPLGMFVQDYRFVGEGDLDVSNGRYCVTPEYPLGTYAYFCTIDPITLKPVYPYVIGNYYYSTPVGSGQQTSTSTNGGGLVPKQTG